MYSVFILTYMYVCVYIYIYIYIFFLQRSIMLFLICVQSCRTTGLSVLGPRFEVPACLQFWAIERLCIVVCSLWQGARAYALFLRSCRSFDLSIVKVKSPVSLLAERSSQLLHIHTGVCMLIPTNLYTVDIHTYTLYVYV